MDLQRVPGLIFASVCRACRDILSIISFQIHIATLARNDPLVAQIAIIGSKGLTDRSAVSPTDDGLNLQIQLLPLLYPLTNTNICNIRIASDPTTSPGLYFTSAKRISTFLAPLIMNCW